MVALLKIRLTAGAVPLLLNMPEVKADLRRRANSIVEALPEDKGEEWEVIELQSDRPSFVVRPANVEARISAAQDMSLIKALDAGR